jgi:hypothetical protein
MKCGWNLLVELVHTNESLNVVIAHLQFFLSVPY